MTSNLPCAVLALLCALSGRADAQTVDPTDLHIPKYADAHAAVFLLDLGPGLTEAEVRTSVTLENKDAQSVSLEFFMFADDDADHVTVVQTVPFLPTAATPRAGRTNVLYVLGWSSRLEATVIEEWTFQAAVGSTTTPSGEVIWTMTTPAVQRSLVGVYPQAGPTISAATYLPANELWLLSHKTPRRIHAVDLATSVATLIDGGLDDTLDPHHSVVAGQHTAGGFFMILQPRHDWAKGYYGTPYPMHYYIDGNADGVLDGTGLPTTYASFYDDYPDAGWVADYQE